MNVWQIIDSGSQPAAANMSLDAELLQSLTPTALPILHLYCWQKPSITYGYFTQIEQHLDLSALITHNIDIARRPTGGGITLHLCDFTFSILIPATHTLFAQNSLANYQLINSVILTILQPLLPKDVILQDIALKYSVSALQQQFCSAHIAHYDLVWQGKKIGGAAQRKTKVGLLHQMSLFLMTNSKPILQQLILDKDIVGLIQNNSTAILSDSTDTRKSNQYQKVCHNLLCEKIHNY